MGEAFPHRGNDAERVRRLIAELSDLLGADDSGHQPESCAGAGLASTQEGNRTLTARKCSQLRRLREEALGASLFADPAWDILLDLYAERHSPRACAVTNLCQAAHVPATTALRWIARLEAHGCITRSPDPTDGRRVYVHLTPETLARLDRLMDGFLHHRS